MWKVVTIRVNYYTNDVRLAYFASTDAILKWMELENIDACTMHDYTPEATY